MSKALSTVLTIASVAVLAYATAGIGIGLAGGFSLGTSISGVAASLGISSGLLIGASLAGISTLVGGGGAPKPEQTQTAIKSPTPPRVSGYGRQRLFMAYALYDTAGNGSAVDVGVFHDGRVDAIEQHYLGDSKVTVKPDGYVAAGDAGEYGTNGDIVRVGTTLGPSTNTAFAPVIAILPDQWTTDHRGDGVVTGYVISQPVKAKDYQMVYPKGGPNQQPLSLAMRLQPVFDWRDSTQSITDPLTWKWSENACLHLAHYLLIHDNKDWATHFAPTLSYWTAAANDCDVAMPLKSGATEPRYRGCVVHKHTDARKDVKANLLACFDGWLAPRADGALIVYSGRYTPPTEALGPDEIISYSVQDGVDEEDAVNSIAVTYISADHDFSAVDTDAWEDADDIAARGKTLADTLEIQSPSFSQNRRLAKRKMARAMARRRGQLATNAAGRRIRGHRYITIDLTDAGVTFFAGVVEVTKLTRNLATGGVTIEWVEADPNIDAWNPATEEGLPAPVGDRVAPQPLEAPSIISATATFAPVGQNPDGEDPSGDPTPGGQTTGARVLIAADGPLREDITWYARWRVGTTGSWNEREYADADPGPGVSFATEFVPLASNINVGVAYSVGDGRLSPWSASVVVDTRPPA